MSPSQLADLLASHVLIWTLGTCLLVALSVWGASFLFRSIWGRYHEWIESHFTRIGYLRLYIVSGVVATSVFAWAFGECVEMAFRKNPDSSFDALLAKALHAQASVLTINFFDAITFFGGTIMAVVLGSTVGVWLLRKKEYPLLTMWCVGLIGNTTLIHFLKLGFHRPRPVFDDPYVLEPYYSFPSGHTMTSVVLYGLLAYVTFKLAPSYANRTTATLLILLGSLIGMSRLVLGAHFFSDVLGGWVLGLGWVAISVIGTQIYLSWRGSRNPRHNQLADSSPESRTS